MSNPVPLMRVYHFAECECYKCNTRRENNLRLTGGQTKTVLAVVSEEIEEITPIAIQALRCEPKPRRHAE